MRIFKSIIILTGILLLLYSCNVFHYNIYNCRDTQYQNRTFELDQTIGGFNICGSTHYLGGVLNVPLPKNQIIDSWFTKPPPPKPGTRIEMYHLRSMFYVSYFQNNKPLKIKFTGTSRGGKFSYNRKYRDTTKLRDNDREVNLRKSSEKKRIQTSNSLSSNRFKDSKLNRNYDIYISNDSLSVTKIFYWYDDVRFEESILNITLLDSHDNPIKYGIKEYSTFKSCMLDDIVFHFSQARMDSIQHAIKREWP